MKRLLLAVGLCWCAVASAAPPTRWAVFMPRNAHDEHNVFSFDLGDGSPAAIGAAIDSLARPVILYEGSAQPSPIRMRVENNRTWYGLGERNDLRACAVTGLIAIQADSVTPAVRRFGAYVSDLIPRVIVLDTTGVIRASFLGARTPRWSPNGRLLALATLRDRSQVAGYARPEVPESVLIWNVTTGSRASYAIPAYDLAWGWGDSTELLVDTGSDTYSLIRERGDGMFLPCPGIETSPDRKYIAVWRGVYRSGLWRLADQLDLTPYMRRQIGGAAIQASPPPFWVSGTNGHVICIGVADQPDWRRMRQSTSEYPAWRTVFLDVEKMKVLRSIDAWLVAPAADLSAAVVRKGQHFEFVGPDAKK